MRGQANHRLLAISLTLTSLVMVVQIVGAVLTGSLALLADAAHMFADASALVIALIASVVAARPANERNTYGYQRAEVFGALINAVLLIVLCVWIAVEAVQRLLHPSDVEVAGGLMIVVATVDIGFILAAIDVLEFRPQLRDVGRDQRLRTLANAVQHLRNLTS